MIIILNNNILEIEKYKRKSKNFKNISVYQLDEKCTLGQCLNYGIGKSRYDYFSKMDYYYGANYLTDIMNVFKYTEAKVVGKAARFVYYEESNILTIDNVYNENKYITSWMTGGTITAKKEIFHKVKFRNINCGEDVYFFNDCISLGIKMYAGDKYNYVYKRHENLENHTYIISSEQLIKNSIMLIRTKDFVPIVTV